MLFRKHNAKKKAAGVLTARWLCSVWCPCRNRHSQARKESKLKTIKGPAHSHSCFQLLWLIKAEYRVRLDGAELRVR